MANPTMEWICPHMDRLRAKWVQPNSTGGTPLIGYEVRYRKADQGTFKTVAAQGTDLSLNIMNLNSDTNYEFQVRAQNTNKSGSWSNSSYKKTNKWNEAPQTLGSISNMNLLQNGDAQYFAIQHKWFHPTAMVYYSYSVSSSNSNIATASISGLNLLVRPGSTTGTATISLTATDLYNNTATLTFSVTVSPATYSAPTVTAGTGDGSLNIEFSDQFTGTETRAYDVRIRQREPVGFWENLCKTASSNAPADTTQDIDIEIASHTSNLIEPGVLYEVQYRHKGSSCNSNSYSGWSEVASATTNGTNSFDIEIVFGNSFYTHGGTANHKEYVMRAVRKWETILVGDLPNVSHNGKVIDDIEIHVHAANAGSGGWAGADVIKDLPHQASS